MTNKEIGILGENAAVNYLIANGHMILNRNYRVGHLEVDIIALKDNILKFIEVKTRSVNSLVSPYESINYRKQNFIINAANAYINRFRRK